MRVSAEPPVVSADIGANALDRDAGFKRFAMALRDLTDRAGSLVAARSLLVTGKKILRDPTSLGLVALALVMTASMALPLAGLAMHATNHFPESTGDTRTSSASLRSHAVDLTPILKLAPFGSASRSSQTAATGTLSLRGIIHSTLSNRSMALISDAGRPADAYRVGDVLPGDILLDAVGVDHVVLLTSGHRERLDFPKAADTATAPVISAARFGMPDARMFAPAVQRTPDEIIDIYRQRIAADPKAVIDDLGVSATPEGYRVGQQLTPQLRRLGLRPGDLIVRINGKAVGNMEQDRANFDDVALSVRARVEIKRDGRLHILSFPLR